MKVKHLLILGCLLVSGSMIAQKSSENMSYATEWNKVDDLNKKSQPKSALEEVDKIFRQAVKDKNSPQIIRSLIYKSGLERMIDDDSAIKSIEETEQYLKTSTDPAEKSMLYSVLAGMYRNYYLSQRYKISGRTEISGYTPDDMREWSKNLFVGKIIEYIRLSVQDEKVLQNTDALKYAPTLDEGEDSRIFRPTLYDFLANRGIDILQNMNDYSVNKDNTSYLQPAQEFVKIAIDPKKTSPADNIIAIYQRLIAFRSADKNKEALLQADLSRLNYAYTGFEASEKDQLYLSALQNLEQEWQGKDASVEILYEKANFYLSEDPVLYRKKGIDSKTAESDKIKKAYDVCTEGITKYPKYRRIGLLTNLQMQLTEPYARSYCKNSVYPNSNLEMKINYRNIRSLKIQIYKIAVNQPIVKNWGENSNYKTKGTLLKEYTYELKAGLPYETNDTTITIPVSGLGLYEYVLIPDGLTKNSRSNDFAVTELASIARNNGNNKVDFLVTDRISGKPVEGAVVQLYDNIYAKNITVKETIKTGKDGIASYSGSKGYAGYSVISGNDKAGYISGMPWGRTYTDKSNEAREQLTILTDRSIYRPGQTVFFKGIAWKANDNTSTVIPNKTFNVSFKDANRREIAAKTLVTNEYGSFTGEFIIPAQVLSGSFGITAENQTTYITVSEYKRPTFKIDFLPIADTYSFGDQISIKGNAQSFSGVPLQSVDVNYRVVRRPHFLYRILPNRNMTQIAEGTAQIDASGNFTVSFKAERERSDEVGKTYYTYEIIADITDMNGETQQGTSYISVGDKSMYLTFAFDENIDKTKNEYIKLTASNLNGAPIQTKGTYTLYSLIDETSLKKTNEQPEIDVYTGEGETQYKIDKEVLSGQFSAPDSISVSAWKNLPSGRYRIIAKAPDSKGNEVTDERNFVLYSKDDKRSPILTYEWLVKEKTTCKPGENAEIILGTSAKDVSVLYEIFNGTNVVERKRFDISNENKKLLIPYKQEYGNNITLALTYIKDEAVFGKNIAIRKETESKNLKLKFDVFRNKLYPGQKEEWKLTVKDDKNTSVVAEILAGMYDASLDKIQMHNWYFDPRATSLTYINIFTESTGFNIQNDYIDITRKYADVPGLNFDALKDADFYMFTVNQSKMRVRGSGGDEVALNDMAELARPLPAERNAEEGTTLYSMAPESDAITVKMPGVAAYNELSSETTPQEVQVRQNFNETAFFLPQLKTDAKGDVVLSFTVPESTTSWKFMGLAHTKELKFGQLTAETVTQKDLMVTPNIPRFMRQGDKTSVSAKIANLSEHNLQGKATLELFDPETEKTVISVNNAEQDFTVNSSGVSSVSWNFDVPEGIELLGCRIVAQTDKFSDGEQHVLPVLSNRILITESMPMTLRGNQAKEFMFDNLLNNKSNTLSNYRLTLEFTGNPAWYAVQALPTLSNPVSDNVISWFASYYVNTLAGHIARSNPEIKKVVDLWQKQAGSKETLLSSLEKNSELKSVLLQETPWVLDAKDETEQKQRLSLLFDITRQSQLTSDAIKKVKELQNEDGGWMWFKGMRSDRYVTTSVLENMYRLIKLNAVEYGESEKMMQINALNYLDKQIAKDYADLKKNTKISDKGMYIDDMQMYYLCVRSCYRDIPINGDAMSAYKFYANQAEQHRTKLTLYGKAQAAMFFNREGKYAVVNELITSLKEHSTDSDEMGMFWANNRAGYFWNQSAIAVQTTILEAFDEVGNNVKAVADMNKDIEEMKLWLLKQKQTQSWDAVPSTVNAIYALLLNGRNLLSDSNDVTIRLGNKTIDTSNKEVGTGYIKQSFDKQEITPDMGKVTATKPGEGIAWGALYWQYFENTDNITKQGGALSVDKKLFIERTTATGKVIEPVTESNALKVGDRAIIRLTVRTDRDLEYVHLKDLRAACFEPVEQLSGYRMRERTGYYQEMKDVSANFYFNYLAKGTYVFEYPVWVTGTGDYSNGTATIQCMYAPEFVSHSEGSRITVK